MRNTISLRRVMRLVAALLAGTAVPSVPVCAGTLDFGSGTVWNYTTPAPLLAGEAMLPEPQFDENGLALVGGLLLWREIVPVAGGYRLSLQVTNQRAEPVRLVALTPLQITRQQDCLVAGTSVDAWRLFRLARHKNDIPGPFRPAVRDDASRDAATDNSRSTNSTDEPTAEERRGTRYHADPGFVIMPDGREPSCHLFVGFDGQTEHLNEVVFELADDRSQVRLVASAEFDGVLLAPGQTRRTHDLYLQTGADYRSLLDRHVERIRRRYGQRTSPLRNVFCTWYFYGPEIVAEDLRADLAEMQRRPVNFDTFLIDYNWDDRFGDWNADPERFPEGMKAMADEIRAAGLVPGIWTCPLSLEQKAEALQRYPDLPLKNRRGEHLTFAMNAMETCYIVDPTAPSAEAFLTELVQKLTGWGYGYLKFDFLRAVVIHEDAAFHDPTVTRAEAYKRAIDILRRAAGPETVIGVWGGLYEANAGFVDINRSGSDVRGHWDAFGDYPHHTRYQVRMRQTFARSFYDEKLWTSDQDALMLRRRTTPWRGARPHLTMGRFTDEEAYSLVVYRFLGGGVVQVSEKLDELDQDRYDLYRLAIPTFAPVARYFDEWNDYLPEKFVSHFPEHPSLAPWSVVTLANWNGNQPKSIGFRIGEIPNLPAAPAYAAFELKQQKFLGVFDLSDVIELELPAHGARVVRLTPLKNEGTHLVGTDLNLSAGMELDSVTSSSLHVRPELRHFPVRATLLEWRGGQAAIHQVVHQPRS